MENPGRAGMFFAHAVSYCLLKLEVAGSYRGYKKKADSGMNRPFRVAGARHFVQSQLL
jgi:hypothetical protein